MASQLFQNLFWVCNVNFICNGDLFLCKEEKFVKYIPKFMWSESLFVCICAPHICVCIIFKTSVSYYTKMYEWTIEWMLCLLQELKPLHSNWGNKFLKSV